jgi:hypothetical protein
VVLRAVSAEEIFHSSDGFLGPIDVFC